MEYYPTPTFSGKPYMSVDQRMFFNERKAKLLQEMPELLEYNDLFRYAGLWEQLDFRAFLKSDCHKIGRHPIHIAFLSLYEYRKTYEKRSQELDCGLATGAIDIAMHECLKFELDINKAYVEAQFCVKAKREYDKVYGETQDRAKFVERLQQTINERLNALTSAKAAHDIQAAVTSVG
jgi:hypothetical protein